MSRHLNVLRVTCQRVVQAVQDGSPSALMLARLPGIEGLQQVLNGFAAVGSLPADVESAQSAVQAFERLITLTGGSQSKLSERLAVSTSARPAADGSGVATVAQRETLFHAAAAVTGRRCDVSLAVYAFRAAPEDPTMLERGLAKGLIGSMITPGGMPMVLNSGNTLEVDDKMPSLQMGQSTHVHGRTPEAILRPFTTDPLPMITSRGKRGTLFQIVDPDAGHSGEPIDVVTALKARSPMIDPQTNAPSLDAVWSLVNCPTARLILDVYLHADMERLYRPTMDSLQWSASLDIPDDQKWVMRLPNQPRLQLLGRGVDHAATELYPRHAELSRYFFRHIGWDPEQFVGFRCEVIYPIWRAGYCMGFEYLGANKDGADRE